MLCVATYHKNDIILELYPSKIIAGVPQPQFPNRFRINGRQPRERVLQNWSLFASSGAFELAPFFLKTRQGRKGSIFGAPKASQNR